MAHPVSDKLSGLIDAFAQLPGVGPKTAEKFAFYVLKSPVGEAMRISHAIDEVKHSMHVCSKCFALADNDPCVLCTSDKRDRTIICVVEQPKDVWTLERAGSYNGLYHVLMGRVAPLDGVGPDDLTLTELVKRIGEEGVREVIIATNPDAEGDITATCVRQRLEPTGVRVTRLARGVPTGGTLEHASKQMLSDAFDGRRDL